MVTITYKLIITSHAKPLWRVMVLEEFLHTALLYQATNTRNMNVLDVLKQYLILVKKEQWGDFPVQSDFVGA